jgi:hypothetical protein
VKGNEHIVVDDDEDIVVEEDDDEDIVVEEDDDEVVVVDDVEALVELVELLKNELAYDDML